MKKCLVMFSNGLDSRLALKIMLEKGYSVTGLYVKLPFSNDAEKQSEEFFKENNSKLKVLDYTRGNKLKEYLNIINKHKFPLGAGVNPCLDCKIFMFKRAKEIADKLKINIIVSGDVLYERPMSQMPKGLKTIEEESGLKNRVFRPLSAKLLDKVENVDKEEYFEIKGRQRKEQMKLAEKFKISYPTPAGGCRLCEPSLRKRLKFLLKNDLIDEKTLLLINLGRHFEINKMWFVVAKNEEESEEIEKFSNSIESNIKTPAVYYNKKEGKETALSLQKAYKEKNPQQFEEYRL